MNTCEMTLGRGVRQCASSIAVIPARGGSKGVPRKNLRPLFGMPLIYYAIRACIDSEAFEEVVVTTDDEEIGLIAERFGARVIMRPHGLGQDSVTLDPVIEHAVDVVERMLEKRFDIVMTVQPTSPLVNSDDIRNSLSKFDASGDVDSVLSVVDDRHLCWTRDAGFAIPKYQRRVNRQQLPESYKETGAVIACRRNVLKSGSRIGKRVELAVLPPERSIDIDSDLDFFICEAILARKTVVFPIVGRKELGLGHAYRAVMIASEFVGHEIVFVCENRDELAAEVIRERNYRVVVAADGGLQRAVLDLSPDLVVNDILNTSAAYIKALKEAGAAVVNFEDLGEGALHADVVVNALYPHQDASPKHLIGEQYFCLRDEFIHLPSKKISDEVRRILITFGGVDENDLTSRLLTLCAPFVRERDIQVDIVAGPGYCHGEALSGLIERESLHKHVRWLTSTRKISEFMLAADLALTSGGRTVLELSAVGVPTMVICQNERETTHTFASDANGVVNLGLHSEVTDDVITAAIESLIGSADIRRVMVDKMTTVDLTKGKHRVVSRIFALLKTLEKQHANR
ncbi:N-acylneuraminate cytidylyltransferase [Caballeronia calidae]|uniref:N-acylneuraminate cytidylyltransferase n=1 Tax=Caballeronia calidae TaxID=1777139 RepID=A0A158BZ20_9BURK|nr:hypothetical protein [Caballeronia calidae]SAK75348.1 N-acylneuraminate cytidylyltransferase [Caballeronia calidae]